MRLITLILIITSFLIPIEAYAGSNPCTSISGSYVNGYTGDCLAAGGGFDSIDIQVSKPKVNLVMDGDISASTDPSGFLYFWRDITFTGVGSAKSDIEIEAVSPITFQPNGTLVKLNTQLLTLDNVYYDNNVNLQFSGTDNKITFKNSSTFFQNRGATGFISTAPMTFHSESGNNEFIGWSGSNVASDTTFTIDAASRLTFDNVTNNSSDRSIVGATKFNGDSVADINGVLEFKYSNINFVNGIFDVNNSGELVADYSSFIYLDQLNVNSGGKVTVSSNANLTVNDTINLSSGTLDLPFTGKLNAGIINVDGNSTISGSTGTSTIDTQVLQGGSGDTLQVNGINQFDTDTLILANGFTINTNKGDLRVKGDLVLSGGTLNITAGATFNLFGETKGSSGVITVNASNISLGENAVFNLADSSLSLSNNASMGISGELYTGSNLTLSTDANSTVSVIGDSSSGFDGILSPGDQSTSATSDVIGTLTTDSKIRFTGFFDVQGSFSAEGAQDLLDTGSFDGGYYLADLRLNGSTPENDQILYGDGDVNLSAMKALKIRVHGSPTAASLDGKEFTVLAAQNGTKTGQIIFNGQELDLEEDSGIPVLIDFFAVDNQTNGKEDITLVAEEQLPITLKKHTSVDGKRNREEVAALLPTTAVAPTDPAVPAQTPDQQQAQQNVYDGLQNTTNGQVGGSFNSIHPEAISSNMTIQIEQADHLLNTLLSISSSHLAKTNEADVTPSSFIGGAEFNGNGLWSQVNYTDGHVDGQGDLGGFNYYLSSTVIGGQLIGADNYGAGAFFGYSKQVMHEHDDSDMNFNTDAYLLGVYGNMDISEQIKVNWAFGHGFLNTSSSRVTYLGSINETAKADYDSQLNFLGARASYEKELHKHTQGILFAGVAYLRNQQDAFKETQATNLGLSLDSTTAHSSILSLGGQLKRIVNAGTQDHLAVGLRYDFDMQADSNAEHDVKAAFNFSPTNKQSFVGQNRGAHSFTLDAAAEHAIKADLLVSLNASYTHSNHGYESAGGLMLDWLW